MKNDIIAFIGGVSLGIVMGINLCEWDGKRRKRKELKRKVKRELDTYDRWKKAIRKDAKENKIW